MARERSLDHSCHRAGAALAVLAALLFGCGQSDTPTGTEPPLPTPDSGPAVLLAATDLPLPAAVRSGDRGEHETFFVAQRVPADLAPTAGGRLLVSLEDVTRPGLVCPSNEPEGGCATVDWSGDPADPRVPDDGIFVNRLRVELVSGVRDYYLSRTLRLSEVPDLIDPAQEHTAVGGIERRWQTVLPTDLRPGTDIELRLVMTKWQQPTVQIRVQIFVLPGV